MIRVKTFRLGGKHQQPREIVPVKYYVQKKLIRILRGCNAYETDLGHYKGGPFLILDWHHKGSYYPGRLTIQIGFNNSQHWKRCTRRLTSRS
jgi:hypothetical protein